MPFVKLNRLENLSCTFAFFTSNRSNALFAEIELEIKYQNACICFEIKSETISKKSWIVPVFVLILQ